MSTPDPLAEMWRGAPLLRFSSYSHTQVQTLQELSAEVVHLLDSAIAGNQVDGQLFQRIYGLFWLWVLGAYEVTRTMSEYRSCFTDRLNSDVMSFKRSVATLRIPFAKQQFQY